MTMPLAENPELQKLINKVGDCKEKVYLFESDKDILKTIRMVFYMKLLLIL